MRKEENPSLINVLFLMAATKKKKGGNSNEKGKKNYVSGPVSSYGCRHGRYHTGNELTDAAASEDGI